MKKSDLKTGMVILFQNGEKGVVLKDVDPHAPDIIVMIGKEGGNLWLNIDYFLNENLETTSYLFKDYKISQIYSPCDDVNLICEDISHISLDKPIFDINKVRKE